ncbi:hypothetical protein HID58_066674 [Brassica napus]|uniref:Uncharacterized protein n=1 Tax=Brassica napus TaxID=3708 RepID=A0ABQ7ZGU6_BRANA|nr:hypothetical protein HID58_066674 [Brassica napus]
MTPKLCRLMAPLRRGSPRWLAFTHDRIQTAYALPLGVNRATPVALVVPIRPKKGRGNKRKKEKEVLLDRPDESSEAQSPGLLARPVSIAILAGGTRKASDNSASSAGDRVLNDEVDSLTHRRRRRVLEEINTVTSGSSSSGLPPPLRVSGEGTSRINPGVRLSSVAREVERQREAEIEESKRKLAAAEAEKVAIQSDLDSMKEKHRREIEGRDRQARKDHHLARPSLAREHDGVLAVVKNKLKQKKKETAAEIRLQEVRARIEALTEYNEGGFELEAELERLKDLEISLEVDSGLASVSDPSLSRFEG